MKISIQDAASMRFIGVKSKWVASLASARDFHDSKSALSFCFGHQLSTIDLQRAGRDQVERIWRVADAGTAAM